MTTYAAHGFVRGMSQRVDKVSTPNEKSLSFLVTFGTFDYLISGDLIGRKTGPKEDAKVEAAVGAAIAATDRKVDVLHVNHHGADNGSDFTFLEAIKPNIAIISAGNGNTHKHPVNDALRRLYDADVYRTIMTSFGKSEDRLDNDVRNRIAVYQNDVIITSDGSNYEISTSRRYKTDKNYVPKHLQNLVHD